MDETFCDPLDPNCLNFKKTEVASSTSESKVYLCDTTDPKSECYKPLEIKKNCPETKFLDDTTNTCKYLEIYFGSFEELFDVQVMKVDVKNSKETGRMLCYELKKKIVS